ncbi:hypothetical protein GVN24_02335 [Rhizobium sp. CRIBSB]|nr:hypothetical protein [Rhizobium sp. CRIBSB]
MEEVTHAVQMEPGQWRVYVQGPNYRRCKLLSALEFSKMLRGEKYKADLEIGEWDDSVDKIGNGPKLLDG